MVWHKHSELHQCSPSGSYAAHTYLKRITIRHFLPTFRFGTYVPELDNIMGLLLQHGHDALGCFPQAKRLKPSLR